MGSTQSAMHASHRTLLYPTHRTCMRGLSCSVHCLGRIHRNQTHAPKLEFIKIPLDLRKEEGWKYEEESKSEMPQMPDIDVEAALAEDIRI